ncbi:MAG: alpha/beta fold hydrolase [Pseudomonadota bacterium]
MMKDTMGIEIAWMNRRGETATFVILKALVCMMTLMGVVALTACSTTKVIGLSELSPSDVIEIGATPHTLLVASSRAKSDDPREYFSGDRSHILHLNKIEVSVPPVHEVGSIKRSGNSRVDPMRHIAVGKPLEYEDRARFIDAVNEELDKRSADNRDVLLFIHGYNTSFSAAILRVTQFVHDTGFEGVPILFSWASLGKTLDYAYDVNSALHARPLFTDFAVALGEVEANNFDVLAHSMGSFLAIEALNALQTQEAVASETRLRRVILASPDIDFDVFRSQMAVLGEDRERVYVLISKDDDALSLSQWLAGGVPRLGSTDPEKIASLGVNVLDLSRLEDGMSINHSKFASSPEAVEFFGHGMDIDTNLSAIDAEFEVRRFARHLLHAIQIVPSLSEEIGDSMIITFAGNAPQ